MEFNKGTVTASTEEIALCNMHLTEAIFELPAEKGPSQVQKSKSRLKNSSRRQL